MPKTRWTCGPGAFLALLVATAAGAADGPGTGVVGWVEDIRGTPVPGALISVYGQGIRGGGVVAVADDSGRFALPSLPPGSYTLRALGQGHQPAPPRRITVLPNRASIFSVSLTPLSDQETVEREARDADEVRELRWLLRHKRRSVLEARGHTVAALPEEPRRAPNVLEGFLPWLADVSGSVELMANPDALRDGDSPRDDQSAGVGVLRLTGRLTDAAHWSLSGLVAETDTTAWRMAGEFVVDTGSGHQIHAGSGYGTGLIQPMFPARGDGRIDDRSVGALFLHDRWRLGEQLTAAVGARYSYIGFLERRNHLDPLATLEYTSPGRVQLTGTVSARTLVPGGDLLTVSTLTSPPALTFALMDERLRAERVLRAELMVSRSDGPVTLSAHGFHEGVSDPLVNAFEGPPAARRLRIVNGRSLSAKGVGVSLVRRFGDAVRGSLTYTYGRSRATGEWRAGYRNLPFLGYDRADFHDLVARLDTVIGWTDTRLMALYRINSLSPEGEVEGTRIVRFDVQLSQGLPLLSSLTRADWDVLVAFRNLFYEATEGATLDELAVINPPKRILGGIAVRF